MPAAVSDGYPSENRSFLDKAMYNITKSKGRKDWKEIFFHNNFNTPLTKENAGIYKEASEMIRIASSGFSKQPWRVVKIDDNFHFFIDRKNEEGRFDYNKLNIGIAMCHFELALNELGIYGKWINLNLVIAKENMEYVISFTI